MLGGRRGEGTIVVGETNGLTAPLESGASSVVSLARPQGVA
jgi:hypothetical protein